MKIHFKGDEAFSDALYNIKNELEYQGVSLTNEEDAEYIVIDTKGEIDLKLHKSEIHYWEIYDKNGMIIVEKKVSAVHSCVIYFSAMLFHGIPIERLKEKAPSDKNPYFHISNVFMKSFREAICNSTIQYLTDWNEIEKYHMFLGFFCEIVVAALYDTDCPRLVHTVHLDVMMEGYKHINNIKPNIIFTHFQLMTFIEHKANFYFIDPIKVIAERKNKFIYMRWPYTDPEPLIDKINICKHLIECGKVTDISRSYEWLTDNGIIKSVELSHC